jgi:hypothetical protein
LNVGSCIGRVVPGILADKIGPYVSIWDHAEIRFNVMIMCTSLTAIFSFGLWLPTSAAAPTIAYAMIFGITSGGYISIMPVLVGRISELRDFGTRYGTVLIFASIAYELLREFIWRYRSLTGVPIGGSLIGDGGTDYFGLIVWTGATNVLASFFFMLARRRVGGTAILKYV